MDIKSHIDAHKRAQQLQILNGFKEIGEFVKGRKAQIGEIRTWSGKKYQKMSNGDWESVKIQTKTKDAKTALSDLEKEGKGDSDHALALKNKIRRLGNEQEGEVGKRQAHQNKLNAKKKLPVLETEIEVLEYDVSDLKYELENAEDAIVDLFEEQGEEKDEFTRI